MKTIKIFLSAVVITLLATWPANGQSSTDSFSEEQKEEFAANMEEFLMALDLTDEQEPQFREISRRYADQMKEVRDGGGSKMQKFKKLKTIRKNKNAEMREILNDEQYQVYLQKQEENQQRMKERRRNR